MALRSMLEMQDITNPPPAQGSFGGGRVSSMLDMPDITRPPVITGLSSRYGTRDAGIVSKIAARASELKAEHDKTANQPWRILTGQSQLSTAATVINGLGDIAGSMLSTSLLPFASKQDQRNILDTAAALYSGSPVSKVQEKFDQWAPSHPELAKSISDLFTVASVIPADKFASLASKAEKFADASKIIDVGATEAGSAAKPPSFYSGLSPKDAQAVDLGINKGIKPSMKGTASANAQYMDRARTAFGVINEYRPTLTDEAGNQSVRTPSNRAELLDAIGQAKTQIFSEYNGLAKQAGSAGAQFDVSRIVDELGKIEKDLKFVPEVRQYAAKIASQMGELQGASPDVIQERIKHYNSSLQSLYDGRVSRANAQVDMSVANVMREELDAQINALTGADYQDLKNKYGSLSAIERDVARQVAVEARRNAKGFFDLTDIFTGSDIFVGVISGNPAMVAKGLSGRALKEYVKFLNDPNRYIGNAFKALDKYPVVKNAPNKPVISGLLNAEPEPGTPGNPLIPPPPKDTSRVYTQAEARKSVSFHEGGARPGQLFLPSGAELGTARNPMIVPARPGNTTIDMEKQVIPKPEMPVRSESIVPSSDLVAEAKKYATPEEFVENYGTPIFHGTNTKNIEMIGKGLRILSEAEHQQFPTTVVGDTQIGLSTSTDRSTAEYFASLQPTGESGVVELYLSKDAKVFHLPDGKDSIDSLGIKELRNLTDMGFSAISDIKNVGGESEIRILSADAVKTKRQLSDIWNQAHKSKK